MGFYSPAVIVNDAKRHGIEIRPIDVQASERDCTLEDGAIRLGLRLVRGLSDAQRDSVAAARPFSSIEDVAARAQLGTRYMTNLAAAGALSAFKGRRDALWKASLPSPGPLFNGVPVQEGDLDLPPMNALDELRMDVTYGSAFPRTHPIEIIRPQLQARGILRAADLAGVETDSRVRVAGLVITRQRPGGGQIIYVTLEDETGHVDIAVPLNTFQKYREVILGSPALVVRGILAAMGDARNVRGSWFEALTVDEIPAARSHDFR